MTSFPPPAIQGGRLTAGLTNVARQSAMNMPQRGARLLTSVTTRGTYQVGRLTKARLAAATEAAKPEKLVPRWG